MYRKIFTWLRMKYLFYLILLMAMAFESVAQSNITVTGKVTDEKGGPLPGVSVTLKGTTIGGVTDREGKYNLKLTSGKGTLIFSFVGYKKQEVSIADRKTIDVVLAENDNSLEEVNVVVAYGTQKKESSLLATTSFS